MEHMHLWLCRENGNMDVSVLWNVQAPEQKEGTGDYLQKDYDIF